MSQLEGELRQALQQDDDPLDQYLDWLFDQMSQEGPKNDITVEEEMFSNSWMLC